MSLETLIHTVGIKINTDKESTLNKLYNIEEIFRDESFSLQKLVSRDFEIDEITKVMNELVRQEFATSFYSYDCEKFDSVGNAVSLSEKCEFCGDTLNESSSSHTIKKMFKLNKLFIKLLSEQRKSELDKYIIKDYNLNLQSLIDNSGRLIPFLGAGTSVPLGLPNWKELLLDLDRGLKETDAKQYNLLINRGQFFRALKFLNQYSGVFKDKRVIKKEIARVINTRYKRNMNDKFHNINDILNLNSDFYITTNYDNAFTDYRNNFVMPLNLNEIEDIQDLISENKQRVIHLHGNIEKQSSMIVDEDDYNNLYSERKINDILTAILGNRRLLFIGFSFNDQYFKDLYSNIIKNINGEHFIIVPNLHTFDADEYYEMNLIPIGVNVEEENGKLSTTDYVKAIKAVLCQLL
ncbi:SIR2 family protein [Priestia aryabhattai]|uniref:SIR2 family protein n=1 Tax=Priestia TaxID=2800373 RepID=UPI002040CF92|nr:SIR2 family protein [Priestia megaterium]MCM3154484.1 SIR2 family protein [Priestia megaterium]